MKLEEKGSKSHMGGADGWMKKRQSQELSKSIESRAEAAWSA